MKFIGEVLYTVGCILVFGYLLIAFALFRFRHPWTTGTERLIHLPRADASEGSLFRNETTGDR